MVKKIMLFSLLGFVSLKAQTYRELDSSLEKKIEKLSEKIKITTGYEQRCELSMEQLNYVEKRAHIAPRVREEMWQHTLQGWAILEDIADKTEFYQG